MPKGSWYNGYSPKERDKKFKVLKKFIAKGELPKASGPCALCGDPEVTVEYHDEDYGEPFIWEAPALLCLCRNCHRDKLHKRFWRHNSWFAYIAHIRRGGYARDLKNPASKKEFQAYRIERLNEASCLFLESCDPTHIQLAKNGFQIYVWIRKACLIHWHAHARDPLSQNTFYKTVSAVRVNFDLCIN